MTSCEGQPKHTQKEKKQKDQIPPPHQRHLQVVMMLARLCGTV